jgi:L-threonylcarbamoyladenylate synthase
VTIILPSTPENISRAANILRDGGLVAFPTETVYGLGADALNPAALAKIFQAKGRPTADPLIVHIHTLNDLNQLASQVSDLALTLAETFWPGPLTLVLPKTAAVPSLITAGLGSVAIRLPDHPVALALIKAAGTPIAAPSANLFGHTSPTTAQHVYNDLAGRVDLILDGGPTRVGVESTVLDLTSTPPRILRHGGIPRERIEQVIGSVDVMARDYAPTESLPSPGLLAKHYAPYTPLTLFKNDLLGTKMLDFVQAETALGKSIGVMVIDEEAHRFEAIGCQVYRLGQANNPAAIASHIYNALRWFDGRSLDAIACHDVSPSGIGSAIHDRLLRAATSVIE